MSENPELEDGEEQVNLDPDPAPEDGLGEEDFQPFDHRDSYADIDPNYVPIVDTGDDGEDVDEDEDLTDEEAEPPEEDVETVPFWATYELQGRNLDEGTAWQTLSTDPFGAELEVEVEGLTAGARWEFRIRLADREGRYSRWSDSLQISLPTDFTPPPAPTAPDVDENMGYITSWWDGLLTGETPKDFSHIVKYIQQMHPDGDPDGEPGDPYRFSTMSSAGAFSVGFLLANVQYRSWFTAVDTTGNESPWSEIVEFTPSQAFNTDELEAELEHLNNERLPALEQSLTEEVGRATQAVADFRTEWDENWDPEAIADLEARQDTLESDLSTGLSEAHQAISSFRTEWDESGWDPEAMGQLEARQDVLEGEIVTGLGQVNADLQGFRTEWDESGWDAEEFANLRTRADDLEDNLQQGLANAEHSVRSLAITGPRNINSDPKFETLSNDDIQSWRNASDSWYRTSLAWGSPNQEFVRISADALAEGLYSVSYGGNGLGNAILECLPGETFKARFQVVRYTGWSSDDDYRMEFRWIDGERNGIGWSRIDFGTRGNQAWVEDEVTAPEGAAYFYFRFAKIGTASGARGVGNVSVRPMTTGDLTVDGTMLARHVDMEDFTADAGFIDNAFVNLIQGKMANFDQALIGGNLLKDRSVTTRHLTVADTTDFAPDPIDYVAAWDFVNARVTDNTSSFEGAAIALDNTSTSNSQARGPILPVHPGDEIYVGSHVGWQGSLPRAGTLYLRMEWLEDADSSRETFTNVASTTSAGFWLEGTTTVPDYATHARFYIYATPNSDNPGTIRIRSSKVRVQTGGELIVDGSIKARHGDFADITASDAFLDNAMVNLIQGRMANFDQAIIGGALLKDNSVTVGKLSVIPNVTDYAPDPGEFPELWDLAGASIVASTGADDNPSNVAFRFNQRSGDTQVRGPVRPVTPGKQIRFRGRYTGFGSGTSGASVSVRMEWSGDLSSGRDGYSTFVSIPTSASLGWYSGTVTVPEWAEYGRLYFYQASNSGRDMGFRGSIQCEPMVGSVLIEDGAVKAEHVDSVSLTASSAFLDHAMVNLIQGRMANFDQALIGGTLLKDGAVATRHLTVTNTEELWNSVWWEDLLDTAYIFSPGGTASSSTFHSRFHAENPAGLGGSSFDWRYTTLQGDRGIQTWPTNSSADQRAAFRLGPGKGIPVRPGEKYTLRARYRDTNGSGFFNIDMALFDVETGAMVPSGDVPRFDALGIVHSGSQEAIWTFEIPSTFPRMYMVPSIHSENNSVSGARSVLRPQLFRAMDGKLIVDGLLQASTAELQELFFDTAVGNSISLGIANILTINADQIRSNTWTGQIMTGPVVQSHSALNTGWRIEPGLGLRMWDNSGVETLRLSGTENYFSGRVHAGINLDRGVLIDDGPVDITRGWTDEEEPPEIISTSITPFIEFRGIEGNLYNPSILVDDETGGLAISPGRKIGTASGSGILRLWAVTRANRLISRALEVPTGSESQPGGLRRDGPRTRLQGRTPSQSGSLDMLTSGALGSYSPSGGNYRGGTSWANPPPQGARPLVCSARVSNAATTNYWRGALASWSLPASGSSADGFRFTLRYEAGVGGQSMWFQYIARWE